MDLIVYTALEASCPKGHPLKFRITTAKPVETVTLRCPACSSRAGKSVLWPIQVVDATVREVA